MCLSTLGADILHPTLTLFTAQSLPKEDQALGGALITAMLQIGRAVGLSIASAVETSVEESYLPGAGLLEPSQKVGTYSLLQGLHAAEWFNFALAISAFVVVLCAFRGSERVGGQTKGR